MNPWDKQIESTEIQRARSPERAILDAMADEIERLIKLHENMGTMDPGAAVALSIVVSAVRQAAKGEVP